MSTTTFTTEEIIFFKEHGYVIKKKLIPKEICNKALAKLWEVKKPFKMERDKPETYYGPIDKKFRTGPNESLHVIQDYKSIGQLIYQGNYQLIILEQQDH